MSAGQSTIVSDTETLEAAVRGLAAAGVARRCGRSHVDRDCDQRPRANAVTADQGPTGDGTRRRRDDPGFERVDDTQ